MENIKIDMPYPGILSSNFQTKNDSFSIDGTILSEDNPISLTINGRMNSSDIIFLRKLCGGRTLYERKKKPGYVKILNLENVNFDFDTKTYFTTQSDYGKITSYGTKPKTITNYMFAKLETIEEIKLPLDTVCIESDAFYKCPAKTIIIPDCIEIIEPKSFELAGIESIYINAIRIKNDSFNRCHHLKSIILGENVKYINGAFDCHKELEDIEISPKNKNLKLTDGCVVNAKMSKLILYLQKEDCKQLILQEGIERICGAAFQGKPTLTNIILPDSLLYIGSGAFNCTLLEEIHIPCNVKIITGLSFPSTLKRIYFYSSTPPEIKGELFYGSMYNDRDLTILVPQGCSDVYMEKFKRYKNYIQETNNEPLTRTPRKEVKNRAFYKKLLNELKGIAVMEITSHETIFSQGRFTGEKFITVWESNLYYIKWMVRIGAITNISKEVFIYLLEHYPMKRPAINNLKGLLTISQIKLACAKKEADEEEKRLKEEYLSFIAEQNAYREEQELIKEANRQFEEMMNEYEAWGNLD